MTGVRADQLSALLARVEKAEGPDRELDVLICVGLGIMPVITEWPPQLAEGWTWELRASLDGQKVETWVLHPTDKYSPNVLYGRSPEPLTVSLDASLALCERVLPGLYSWKVGFDDEPVYHPADASVAYRDGHAEGSGKTLPLALLSALLTALIAQHNTSDVQGVVKGDER